MSPDMDGYISLPPGVYQQVRRPAVLSTLDPASAVRGIDPCGGEDLPAPPAPGAQAAQSRLLQVVAPAS